MQLSFPFPSKEYALLFKVNKHINFNKTIFELCFTSRSVQIEA